ncbi:hypothetical protein O181_021670 [Austropuccinia psidii MF-1]|uniref:Uncharacterized protein n=1 Tax=Austropuccinia psidii MF-1 TaxID=1389203 RepID=A0A9Q3CF16_9BASI|nr:hypothetical protein [Austropuccinia psidii MF-1]
MVPPEIEAFQHLSLFMKDISIVTGHLSKMMTSNYSFNYSTSCRRGRKPMTRLEAWKKDHSQEEFCNYDKLSLHSTAILRSRSPRTTKELNLKSFQHTDDSTTNTASEDNSRNNIINSSSNTSDDPISKVSITHSSENVRSGLFYTGRTSKADKPPILNDTLVQKTIITSKNSNGPCIDRTKTKVSTIKTNNNPSNNTKLTIHHFVRLLSSDQYETNTNESYISKEQMSRPTTSKASSRIDKIKLATIDTTINKNEEETILNKVVNYIERKIKNQPISTKERVSNILKNITTYIDNKANIYHLLD